MSGSQSVQVVHFTSAFYKMASQLLPQVVVMDAQMPDLDGVEATKRIKQRLPDIGVLFLSVFSDYLEASVEAGADGYLTKDCELTELLAEIRRIASDDGRIADLPSLRSRS